MSGQSIKRARFTRDEAQHAADYWKFNCGPGALCAVLDLTPKEIRPYLGSFELKGYMSPEMVKIALHNLGVAWHSTFPMEVPMRDLGLIRVQWLGPWMDKSRPWMERYRHTHWIAFDSRDKQRWLFDINAICQGGWMSIQEWKEGLAPWLIRETGLAAKGCTGFEFTHVWTIYPTPCVRCGKHIVPAANDAEKAALGIKKTTCVGCSL